MKRSWKMLPRRSNNHVVAKPREEGKITPPRSANDKVFDMLMRRHQIEIARRMTRLSTCALVT